MSYQNKKIVYKATKTVKNGNNSKVKEKIKDKKSDSNNQYLNEIFYFLLSSSVPSNQLLL